MIFFFFYLLCTVSCNTLHHTEQNYITLLCACFMCLLNLLWAQKVLDMLSLWSTNSTEVEFARQKRGHMNVFLYAWCRRRCVCKKSAPQQWSIVFILIVRLYRVRMISCKFRWSAINIQLKVWPSKRANLDESIDDEGVLWECEGEV